MWVLQSIQENKHLQCFNLYMQQYSKTILKAKTTFRILFLLIVIEVRVIRIIHV